MVSDPDDPMRVASSAGDALEFFRACREMGAVEASIGIASIRFAGPPPPAPAADVEIVEAPRADESVDPDELLFWSAGG